MRKRMLMIMMAAAIGFFGGPVNMISAGVADKIDSQAGYDDEYAEEDDEYEDEDEYEEDADKYGDAYEFTKDDFVVKPAKKTIKVKKAFTISIGPSDDIADEYADLPEEEWEELLNENIDNITYRSSKSSVASVTKRGKVNGKKKGSAIIRTTITFRDGSEGTYKTKVYVTR